MAVCQYYARGHCAFGSNCRNLHTKHHQNQYDAHHRPAQQLQNLSNPYSLLEDSWNQLVWKGSPIWDSYSKQTIFYGLNLSIEELRWEFYCRPSHNWLLYQQNLENGLEEARRACLRQRRLRNSCARPHVYDVPLFKIFTPEPSQDVSAFQRPNHEALIQKPLSTPYLSRSSFAPSSDPPPKVAANAREFFGHSPLAPIVSMTPTTTFTFSHPSNASPYQLYSPSAPYASTSNPTHSVPLPPCTSPEDYLNRYPHQLERYTLEDVHSFLASEFQVQLP